MEVLTGLTKIISSEISSIENRERKRTTSAQMHFEHAIESHTETSEQHSVHVIQKGNKGYQRDSQSHTRHVCDATYSAMLVTHAKS